MRPIARQSARWASTHHKRCPSCSARQQRTTTLSHPEPPFGQGQQSVPKRAFSSTPVGRDADSRPPHDSAAAAAAAAAAAHKHEVDGRRARASDVEESRNGKESDGQKTERNASGEEHNTPSETTAETSLHGDPSRRGGLRRTLRQQRMRGGANEIPKPPPLPRWFLDRNVQLAVDHQVVVPTNKKARRMMKCIDKATGHVLFTIPYLPEPSAEPAGSEKESLLRDRKVLIDLQRLGEKLGVSSKDEKEDHAHAGDAPKGLLQSFKERMGMAEPVMAQMRETVKSGLLEAAATQKKLIGEAAATQQSADKAAALKKDSVKMAAYIRRIDAAASWEKKGTDEAAALKWVSEQLTDRKKRLDKAAVASGKKADATAPNITPFPFYVSDHVGAWTAEVAQERVLPSTVSPMAVMYFELANTVRAGLSMTEQNSGFSSSASRVDISLVCPEEATSHKMRFTIDGLARFLSADVVRIDANDISDLSGDYVGQGQDTPGSFSTLSYDVFDGQVPAGSVKASRPSDFKVSESEEFDEDEADEEDDGNSAETPFGSMSDLRKALHERRHELARALGGLGIAGITIGAPKFVGVNGGGMPKALRSSSSQGADDTVRWDDARLTALLEQLLDAPRVKISEPTRTSDHDAAPPDSSSMSMMSEWRRKLGQSAAKKRASWSGDDLFRWNSYVDQNLAVMLQSSKWSKAAVRIELEPMVEGAVPGGSNTTSIPLSRKTIVHVPDLNDLRRTRLGDTIIRRLVQIVQKRRKAGESIIVIGTTSRDGSGAFESLWPKSQDSSFREMLLAPLFETERQQQIHRIMSGPGQESFNAVIDQRISKINVRHMTSMLRRLRPNDDFSTFWPIIRDQMALPGTRFLGESVLSQDDVQRIVLIAEGLRQGHLISDRVTPVHLATAAALMHRADEINKHWNRKARAQALADAEQPKKPESPGDSRSKDSSAQNKSKLDEVKKSANPHETRLLTGVVQPQNIRVGFDDVHAPSETIEALKTLTSLSLLRPEAFKYGVLANDRLPGLLLYGPPGTGKTMLAKAVAKDTKATVLEVSGAQIYEKYVGEGEKMVRAVFSLAKKLSPCIVFMDEADAIFGARNSAGSRNTHREIINQFLREWDGMEDHSVFIMVATNRPFDLDDAVLRRLPRRLLVDLPVAKDRESILRIHLKSETIEPSVSLSALAEQTPFYSGSDLKNMCVAAALACVREENELLQKHKDDADFKLPEKRTLTNAHFTKAMAEISASVSEDMKTLGEIRKFDEQFGDRRGRRKKAEYGFGLGGEEEKGVDESAVRVRPDGGVGCGSGERPSAP